MALAWLEDHETHGSDEEAIALEHVDEPCTWADEWLLTAPRWEADEAHRSLKWRFHALPPANLQREILEEISQEASSLIARLTAQLLTVRSETTAAALASCLDAIRELASQALASDVDPKPDPGVQVDWREINRRALTRSDVERYDEEGSPLTYSSHVAIIEDLLEADDPEDLYTP